VREVLAIAGPTVATMASYTVMTFVDKLLVSRLGGDPIYVGAQGNGSLASWVPISLAIGILQIVNTYASQNLGAGRGDRGTAYAWNGLWIALGYWALVLLPYSWTLPWIFAQSTMDPRQAQMGVAYGQILLWGALLTLGARGISQFFFGLHKAWIVMLSSVLANVINLFLSSILMFGNGPIPEDLGLFGRVCGQAAAWLGIRPMGIEGSAWGTVIASAFEFALPMIVFLGPRFNARFRTRSAWRPSLGHMRDLVRLGWPGSLMFGNEMACWGYFMVFLVSGFGKNHATAGWIAHQYMSLSFMPAVGISAACTALVGKYMGMKRPDIAQRRTWLCVGLALVYMIACGVAFVVFRGPLVRFFMDSGTSAGDADEIVALGSTFLIATAAFQAFDALAMTTSGALRGAGDTVVPGVVTVLLSWVVIVLGGKALVAWMPEWGSLGPWIAAASYIACLGVFLMTRFMLGRWKTIDVLTRSAGGGEAIGGG
jgi:multidrug resistance protein, MATE family